MVVSGKEVIERHYLDLGVMTLMAEFKFLNEDLSKHRLKEVVESVKDKLPNLGGNVKNAIYSGGELTYMSLVGYNLLSNDVFEDTDHPSKIMLTDFASKNEEVFSRIKLSELEALMPNDPKWMHGARSCSAIAQAICEKYNVISIIPSNSNLINGAVRQEFRTVTISGSFRKHLEYILQVKKKLESQGVKILSPRFEEPKNPGEEFVVFTGEEGLTPLQLERHHLDSILKSDALIVCDPQGYVGASALIEIGFAQANNKRIIFVEKPEEFMLNTLPAEKGL